MAGGEDEGVERKIRLNSGDAIINFNKSNEPVEPVIWGFKWRDLFSKFLKNWIIRKRKMIIKNNLMPPLNKASAAEA